MVGDNTDVYGFSEAIRLTNFNPLNKKALILGAGGVAPSIIFSLIKSNKTNISIVNRTYEKSLFIKNKFKEINVIKWENCSELLSKFDILINATSLGLNPNDDFNLDFSNFKKNMIFIDTIYNPSQTSLLKFFKSKNLRTFNGLNMFIYQGQKSFYLWNKINPEVDDELIKLLESKIN